MPIQRGDGDIEPLCYVADRDRRIRQQGTGRGQVFGQQGRRSAPRARPPLTQNFKINRKVMNWLARVPGNPGSMTRHLGRLSAMAQDDPDVRAFAGRWVGGR